MKNFKMAVCIYSCSHIGYLLLHNFIIDAADKYGAWSFETWIATIIVWLLGVLVTYMILVIENR